MTPQTNFMVLAPIIPAREAELRQLLDSMNEGPGLVNANNSLIPFADFDEIHFSRLLILDDKTLEDVRVYNRPVTTYPLYLAFLGDIDGEEMEFLGNLVKKAGGGLRKIFSCCAGFNEQTDILTWMKQHRAPAIAAYVNWRGRTVRRIHEEAALREALVRQIESQPNEFQNHAAQEVHAKLRQFFNAEKSAGRLTLTGEQPAPIGWCIRNAIHMVALPLLVLIFLPLLIVIAPFYILWLRHLEKTDPEVCPRVDQKHSDYLSHFEDRILTNQFSAMGSLKPGLVRLATVIGVLGTVNYAARHFVRHGRLGRIRTIHFARWVFLDGKKRMIFFSNYDGTVESYMDDFINKTGFGLNAVFGNGIGYPRVDWLVQGGCQDGTKYRNYLRRHTLPTQVWYKAYAGLTAIDLERNSRIREGLEEPRLSEQEARNWAALL
ncbi:MAG: hypothetical protein ACXWF1_08615 [Chthoniobacterales bacterium]